jgi:hypothetical protein
MINRTRGYFTYWATSIRELESKLYGADVKTVARGALYGDGEQVDFEIDGNSTTLKLGNFSRIRTVNLALSIAATFLAANLFGIYKAIF